METTRTTPPPSSAVLTVEEAGRLLGIGRGLAYEAARRGDIPTLRIGRRLVVPRAALDRILNDPGTATANDARPSAA